MFAILVSALNTALAFVFRSVLVKFVLYFGLFFVTTEFVQLITYLLPTAQNLQGVMLGIPAGVWYFLDLFNVSMGLPAILSAFATRFIIRRIPIIG